jgi:DNA-binding response OmpR family regulator
MNRVRNVYLVDDDPSVTEALGVFLTTEGYSVRRHSSARSLLSSLKADETGCVVTDMRMPEMKGLELIRAMKAQGVSIPVILVTGYADVPLAVQAMKMGAVELLEKRLIKTVLRLERTVCRRDAATGLCKQTTEIVFWASSAAGSPPESWNEWIRGHWRIENGSHYVRDVAFAEDASRIRKNPDIVARLRSFAYNLLRASGCDNIKNARWRATIDIDTLLRMSRIG